jgi:ribose transport system permease protein
MTTSPQLAQSTPPPERYRQSSLLMRIVHSRESGVLVAFILLFGLLAITKNRSFLTPENLSNLGVQVTFTAITAIGVLFVILTGGVDLSLGSTVGVSSFTAAIMVVVTRNPYLAVATALAAGILTGMTVGAINGAIVSYVRVTPFIVTLGMLGIGRSVVYILGKNVVAKHLVPENQRQDSAMAVTGIPPDFVTNWSSPFLHVPAPIWVLLVVALGAHLTLKYTVFGRRLYAIGGNEEATQLSGINVQRVKFLAYVVCSALCGITGFLSVARYNSGSLETGKGAELDAIAAAVIGGTSLMGGSGSVLGVILGACVMGVVSNGLDKLNLPPEPKVGIIGSVIIIAAIVDVVRNRKNAR